MRSAEEITEVLDSMLDDFSNGVVSHGEYWKKREELIEDVLCEAYNQALEDAVDKAELSRVPGGCTELINGLRYPEYGFSISTESILKLKK